MSVPPITANRPVKPTRNDPPEETGAPKKTTLADDPEKREAYLERAKDKFAEAAKKFETDPEGGVQSMKEQVKKWQQVLRSEDWDMKDQAFKNELTGLIEMGLDFIETNEKIPSLAEVQADPAKADAYMRNKKKDLENIEDNWQTNPMLYGQRIVETLNGMTPLLEPEVFSKLDEATQENLLKYVDRADKLMKDILGGLRAPGGNDDPPAP
ncbi:MAG TPA: hypothetical protein VFR90_08225 [Methylibium sp.]|uniref:hypothetical protein n=1 Tax=Methylibium sp. TaxID=2067992 RepID=UPI002DBFDF1A|nr:hypothetical protein [Methylibium sp.]HEU4459091.1 hypothetical protein [Methylibium sp.]